MNDKAKLKRWIPVKRDVPDADILVLACYAPSDAYFLASYDGENWIECETQRVLRITHWMDLPDVP